MLHPSYGELLEHVNHVNAENGDAPINSRYSLVMAVARRARDLVNGAPMMTESDTNGRMLGQAVHEFDAEKLGIVIEEPDENEGETMGADEMSEVDLSVSVDDED